MKTEIIKNKKGEILKTKDGVELTENWFEDGDLFIPQNNNIITRTWTGEVEDNGKKVNKTIKNYKIVCKVKGYNNEEDIFVSLKPYQANTLQKKINNGDILNQHLFNAYIFKDDEENEYVGIGLKVERVPAKTFEELENSSQEKEN